MLRIRLFIIRFIFPRRHFAHIIKKMKNKIVHQVLEQVGDHVIGQTIYMIWFKVWDFTRIWVWSSVIDQVCVQIILNIKNEK